MQCSEVHCIIVHCSAVNCRAQCIAVDSAVFSSADLFPWGFARLCFEEEVTETPGDRAGPLAIVQDGVNPLLYAMIGKIRIIAFKTKKQKKTLDFFRLCQMLKKKLFF